jgi:transcription elongation factor SPT6
MKAFKYLKDKPVVRFTDGQFLQIMKGELDGLLQVSIRVDEEDKLMADIHKFICNDFSSDLAELWNDQRKKVAEFAAKEILFPQTVKWLKERLASQASDLIALKCQNSMEQKINMQPFRPSDTDEAPIVMCVSWGDGMKGSPTYVVILNENGEMIDFSKLEKMMDREHRREDCEVLMNLMDRHKPNVIAVGGFKPNTSTMLMRVLKEEVVEVYRSQFGDLIPMFLVDDECARIFMKSKKGLTEFPDNDYPVLIRYLISLGRYVQEPTLEYAGLCNGDDDIRNVRMDPLQHLLSDEMLGRAIERAFINVVNKCGVDVNAAAAFPHLSHSLQFVSGLGPRKAQAIISKIIRSGGKLESRVDLVQKLGIGATVFLNSASFIRIRDFHFNSIYHEQTLDVLDDTRVHPEDYALARKMAADALDLEDAVVDDEENPSVHVKELMDGDVHKLNLLLLEDYAVELEKRLNAPKRVCLMDIKEELMFRYRDTRRRFDPPGLEQVFMMLTGESRDTLSEGSVVSVVVTRVKDRLLIVQLGSGVEGTIFANSIDLPYGQTDLASLFHENQALMACVHKIHYERLAVELSLRQTDLESNLNRVRLDQYFDLKSQQNDLSSKKNMKKQQVEKQVRHVQHPYWQNVNYKAAEKYLETRNRGDVVVRPSSHGKDHISITWKVNEGVYQHIDVLEKQKPNEWTLGKQLVIDNQVFTEIDQIIAEYVEPMTRKIAMLIDHPKYQRKSLAEMCK